MDEPQEFECARCGRMRPADALKVNQANKLACRPDHLEEYDRCMRIWTGQEQP